MQTLPMQQDVAAFCDAHDLYEYAVIYLVTMPNGFRFLCEIDLAEKFRTEQGASIERFTELGE